jgi:hypothetical protein
MPPIRFPCPFCNAGLKAPPEKAGEKFACPKCGMRVEVPKEELEITEFEEPAGPALPDRMDNPLTKPQPTKPTPPASPFDFSERSQTLSRPARPIPPPPARPPQPQASMPPRMPQPRMPQPPPQGTDPPPLDRFLIFGMVSLGLGILSGGFMLTPCLWVVALPVSGVGVMVGLVAMNQTRGRANAHTMSLIGMLISLCVLGITAILIIHAQIELNRIGRDIDRWR